MRNWITIETIPTYQTSVLSVTGVFPKLVKKGAAAGVGTRSKSLRSYNFPLLKYLNSKEHLELARDQRICSR